MVTIGQMKSRAMRHKAEIVFADYLQLMSGVSDDVQTRVSENSLGAKRMAMSMDIPVVMLSQLSRASEQGAQVRKPRLSDLRESGAIEQNANSVFFVHRESYYRPQDESLKGKGEILIGKQRNGPMGIDIEVGFLDRYAHFVNIEKHEGENYAVRNDGGLPPEPEPEWPESPLSEM
jgi:replicative DNA helicase